MEMEMSGGSVSRRSEVDKPRSGFLHDSRSSVRSDAILRRRQSDWLARRYALRPLTIAGPWHAWEESEDALSLSFTVFTPNGDKHS